MNPSRQAVACVLGLLVGAAEGIRLPRRALLGGTAASAALAGATPRSLAVDVSGFRVEGDTTGTATLKNNLKAIAGPRS